MSRSSLQRQRWLQIEELRARGGKLISRNVHQSIRAEVRDVESELDDAVDSLYRNGADLRLHIVLPIADSIIKNASFRLAALETALTLDPGAELRHQLAADE